MLSDEEIIPRFTRGKSIARLGDWRRREFGVIGRWVMEQRMRETKRKEKKSVMMGVAKEEVEIGFGGGGKGSWGGAEGWMRVSAGWLLFVTSAFAFPEQLPVHQIHSSLTLSLRLIEVSC